MRGLKIDPQRIPIILHPYLSRTNGEVVWAPKRVELMTMPPYDDSYPQPWNEQLAIHEGRHIGQMTYYTTGVYGVLHYFLGESSAGLGVGFNPSTWIFESDAVVNETVLSNTGRGRGSALLQYYRAASLEGETRLFDHWRYGSFERFTPNQYSFGYLINSYMKIKVNLKDFISKDTLNLFDYLMMGGVLLSSLIYNIITSADGQPFDWLGFFAAITGVICNVLIAKQNILNYAFGLANVILYAIIAFVARNYGNAALNMLA